MTNEFSTANIILIKKEVTMFSNNFLFSETMSQYNATNKAFECKPGQDIVVFFGSSGSGKSTCATFLAGSQFEEKLEKRTLERFIIPKPGQIEYAKIGHEVDSETSIPQLINSQQEFQYCDTPSFDFNGLDAIKICGTLLTQSAIQQAKTIKGTVLFIDEPTSSNLTRFANFIEALNKMYKDFYTLDGSVLFVITKTDSRVKTKHIIARMHNLAIEEDGFKVKIGIRKLYHMIEKNPDSIHLFNPLDEAQRPLLLKHIQELKPIPKSQFKFPIYDKDHEHFQKLFTNLIAKCITFMKNANTTHKTHAIDHSHSYIKELLRDSLNYEYNEISFALKVANLVDPTPDISLFLELYDQYKNKVTKEESLSAYITSFISQLKIFGSEAKNVSTQKIHQTLESKSTGCSP